MISSTRAVGSACFAGKDFGCRCFGSGYVGDLGGIFGGGGFGGAGCRVVDCLFQVEVRGMRCDAVGLLKSERARTRFRPGME
jgi:hypothetical protein